MTEVTQGDALGDVESAARKAVAAMGELAGIQAPLAQAAFKLARILDSGAKGMAAAAIARDFRETLVALEEASDAGDAASELEAYLSAPLGNTAD